MAPLCIQLTYDLEADHEIAKMRQAFVRHRKLHIKRSEFTRARSARDWTWGKAIGVSKPHHALRVATRTCLAKGAVEAEEDMPSISFMSKPGDKGTRRKPGIAHVVHGIKVLDSLSDIETTADEADLDADGFDVESFCFEQALACNHAGGLPNFALEHVHWPELPLNKSSVPAAADESRVRYCEMALRYRDECLEDKATCERLRAKKAATIRAAREASAWKISSSKRSQMLKAVKKAQHVQGSASEARREVPKSLTTTILAAAPVSLNIEGELETVKMARAAARHKKLHIRRSEFRRTRSARDWTWGEAIEGARPHRAARAALRARLAQGAVQSHEDRPCIVYMCKLDNKGPHRKPAIARMVLDTQVNESAFDVDALAVEVETNDDSRQPAKPVRYPQQTLQRSALMHTSAPIQLAENKPATKRMGCMIS